MTNVFEKPVLALFEKMAGKKLAVAFSGGLDSRVLLELLAENRQKLASLCALHVNFGLRGEESDQDEIFVQTVCKDLQIPLRLHRVSKLDREMRRGESVQEWARRIRYQFFTQSMEEGFTVTLAHHEDDVAENVILRLARGCSAGNLAGMRVLAGAIYRPLLLTPKASILSYAKAFGLDHREDSSNAKIIYSRNYIRQEVLPRLESIFPDARRRIAATGLDAQDLSEYTRSQLLEKLNARGSCQILITDLLMLTPGVALETLSAFLQQQDSKPVHLSRRLLNGILADLQQRDQKPFLRRHLKNGYEIFVNGECLAVEKRFSKMSIRHESNSSVSNQAIAQDSH